MSFGKLYGQAINPRTIPILVAAKANDLDLELVQAENNANAEFNKSAEYRKLNPLGKIPTFVGANGFVLTEAIAIAIYVTSQNEKTTLLGKTKQDYASILRWMSFANSELLPRFGAWYRPLLGLDPYNKKAVEEASKAALTTAAVLESHLTANTFLVGERLTLADIFVAGIFTRAFALVLDKEFREKHIAITRWFLTVVNQPVFKAVVENPVLVDEAIKYTPPKKEEKPKKEAALSSSSSRKPRRRKRSLSPSPSQSTLLRLWRKYSNEDTRPVALPWFWENYKPDEYSLWLVDYKYNNELKLTFMANNLIGGFFNRLEASRKFLFGAASVYGQNYDCLIRGAFLVRGQEHLPAFDVAPDWESFEFKKLDHTKEEDRKLVEDLWAWDVPVVRDGKEFPWADGHVFK
ncbi:Translation elongation factor eEF-1 subunit gamma [Rasamsonia emersonii CBS 393.64]|uniref:Translation elongation factor eEF-1 subunit gamma n=1 Tax=Rasamsonia emersonii (strain ATCC 16479 / CBS 393.64 / IMI 116815) TaxID=1408163 RepID=A0A0F4Z076_RASE3|nr:Translation elongation factor eEF-1 subunit gamma [Rasamsonia emersonii CBS 393.64]KKA23268.1 Translation elongation factor eEF-1 subunit gamma [Rasamsonia emersonii CBS 393.64]